MPALTIPDRYQTGLARLIGLSHADVEALTSALSQAPRTLKAKTLASSVSRLIPTIDPSETARIVDTLWSLYRVRASADTPVSTFATELIEAMQRSGNKELHIPEPKIPDIREQLLRLLNIESLSIAAKAAVLQTDHRFTYCDSRIITDLRPVFGPKLEEGPMRTVIVHTLKIGYHDAGKHKDFYLAMDTDDLAALQKALQRAEDKQKSLRSFVERLGTPSVNIE